MICPLRDRVMDLFFEPKWHHLLARHSIHKLKSRVGHEKVVAPPIC